MKTKTTHEIWKAHYHNDSENEGEIACGKKWVTFDDYIEALEAQAKETEKKIINWLYTYERIGDGNWISPYGIDQLKKFLKGEARK